MESMHIHVICMPEINTSKCQIIKFCINFLEHFSVSLKQYLVYIINVFKYKQIFKHCISIMLVIWTIIYATFGGDIHFPYLWRNDSRRKVNTNTDDDDWNDNCRFPVVRKCMDQIRKALVLILVLF